MHKTCLIAFCYHRWRCALLLVVSAWSCAVPAQSGAARDVPTSVPTFQAKPTGVFLTQMQVALDTSPPSAPKNPNTVDEAAWKNVPMPDRWSKSQPQHAGGVWYRAHVNLANQPQTPWGVYLPRVIMNAEVWINGNLVGRAGSMEPPLTRHWNTPLLFSTPGTSWRAGVNTLHIRVVGFSGGGAGLAVPRLGRYDLMAQDYESQKFWQNDLVYACNIGVMVLGLFVLAIWVRKRERVDYGYFSLGAILWGMANFNMTVREPMLSESAWEAAVYVCIVWALLALCMFTLRFSNRMPRGLERSVWVYALLYALFLAFSGSTVAVQYGKFGLLPVLVVGAWSMWQGALFVRSTGVGDYKLLALVQALTLSLGLHDWLIQLGRMPFESAYGLPFIAPLFVATLGWLIAGDYARVQSDLKILNAELTDRVQAKEAALRESFAKLSELEKERVVNQERTRIMRDMHDGVGMHLSAALRQIQSGRYGTALVEQTLRDSLDQLKLTVDSMSFHAGDVGALLGSLRYRLGPRLEAVGLALVWDVDDLPHWPPGHIENLRHVQFIVFEALSNALQHTNATQLRLSAKWMANHIEVCVHDNGVGFDPAQLSQGKGIRGMQQRAGFLDATLQWLPVSPQGCQVVLRLPMSECGATGGHDATHLHAGKLTV